MRNGIVCLLGLLVVISSTVVAKAQTAYPPGTFYVDGIPVACGPVVFVLDPNLQDVGMARPGYIFLNPFYFQPMSTSAKLFWIGHECGHHVVGVNESAADCWAVRLGRDQGWFPPQTFYEMIHQMQNNPGDFFHPPGPDRVRHMMTCYMQP